MEALIFITCIIIVIVLLTLKSDVNGHLQNLRDKINHLDKEIQRIKFSQTSDESKPNIPIREESKRTFRPEPIEPESISVPPIVESPLEEVKSSSPETIFTPEPVRENYFEPQPIPEPVRITKQPKKTFFERNPDLEKFIGENLANKIGIGILVIGIGFFVKYAIDHSWINPLGRVMIGVLCGGGLIAVGHYMRNKFRAFSSVMAGGGIAVLYITITIAFQLFQLFEAPVAFAIMVFITGFTIALSLGYDRYRAGSVGHIGRVRIAIHG